ncbi:MAG: adenylate/guanylate cyclase domain-containing protein [Anaerolineales bacterium]
MEFNTTGEASASRRTLAGERRVVTILFSDVKGSTAMAENLDPEDWAEIMNDAFGFLTKPIIRYGGTVARLMGDAILAFFGAPIAHEDDPLRAVLAGLDIVNGIQSFREQVSVEYDLDFNVRVGINTGVVVVGEMGSALAGEYTAMGDAVNLAARMEQTAKPGTVQITGETYRLVAPWIEVESLGGIDAKGKSDPVPSYCVLRRKKEPGRSRGISGLNSPLVGRDTEYARLESALDVLERGRGQIVTLIGEAGLGKSRLIEDAKSKSVDQPEETVRWVYSRGISYESARPYSLFVQTLRQVCNVKDDDPPEKIQKKVAESFKNLEMDQQTGILRTVEMLLSVDSKVEDSGTQLEGEALKREIFDSMLNVWQSLAGKQPLVLVFDDLHWADTSSVELLIHLFQLTDGHPIVFLCAFRPHRKSPAWRVKTSAEVEFTKHYLEISLDALGERDSDQLVNNLLVNSELPDDLRKTILEKSEGNPFFLEEVMRTLIDSGMIVQEENGLRWDETADYKKIDIPDSLQALLLARIDRLESEPRRILQLAAVIGRVFYYRVLKSISDGVSNLDDQLVILQRMELIQENSQMPEQEYTFRNELTRDAVYESILRRQRRMYHRKVGEAIENIFGEKLIEEAHQLAYHFNAARDYPRALKYYQIAGDQSFKLFANQEAGDHYQRAIEIALKLNVPSVKLARLYNSRGRALELLNQYDQALDNYEELEELGRSRNDRSLELSSLVPQATIYSTPTVKFNPQIGTELSRRALSLAIELGDSEAEAKTLWCLMLIQTFAGGNLEKAIDYGEQGLRIAREHQLLEEMAYIQHDLARPYMRAGRMNDAWKAYDNSQNYWREVENLHMLSDNLASLSESYYTAGEFDRSMTYAEEGLGISQKIGNVWGQAYNTFVFGPILLERGDIDSALIALDKTLDLSTQANFAAGVVGTQMIQAWLYTMFGDLETADKIQSKILTFVRHYESFRPLYLVANAQHKLYSGQQTKALEIFEEIESNYSTGSELIFHPYIYTLHVEIHLANQNYDVALRTVEDYLQSLSKSQIKILTPDLLNQKSRALVGLGRNEEAYQDLQAARTLAVEQKSRRILWAILLDLADLEKNQEVAKAYQSEAGQIIEYISDHTSDPRLLEFFHKLPKVQKIH